MRVCRKLAVSGFVLAASLAACGPSKEQRLAAFTQRCVKTEFTSSQCAVLAEVLGASIDAGDNATVAATAAGVSVGLAAGGAGGRR